MIIVEKNLIHNLVFFKDFIDSEMFNFCFCFQFNVPFKIISLIETSQSIGWAKREYPGMLKNVRVPTV